MKDSDYKTYRMTVCSDCKKTGANEGCRGDNNDIDNCLDATTPMETHEFKADML